jgi:hypothetical protein
VSTTFGLPTTPRAEQPVRAVWIIKTRDQITGRISETRRQYERGFIAAVKDRLRDPRRKVISVTLPSGKVLDESAVRVLVGEVCVPPPVLPKRPCRMS